MVQLPGKIYVLFSVVGSLSAPSCVSLVLLVVAALAFCLVGCGGCGVGGPKQVIFNYRVVPVVVLVMAELLRRCEPCSVLLYGVDHVTACMSNKMFFVMLVIVTCVTGGGHWDNIVVNTICVGCYGNEEGIL